MRSRGRLRGGLALLGPAFVASVAYIDPGNFATNFTAGAKFGYALAWVIVLANLMAMLVQYLSAKVGVATGQDLAELCRAHLPRPVSGGLWVQAELIAMATDLAEFVGAALGLNLLFHVPLRVAGPLTAVVAFAILALDQRGYRRFELAVCGLLGIVFLGFAYDLAAVHLDPSALASGLVPGFPGPGGPLLVAGIIGATVMPHVVYLHSALTKSRVACADDAERRELLRFQRLDVVIALGLAGLVNLTMLVVAAAMASQAGGVQLGSLTAAHAEPGPAGGRRRRAGVRGGAARLGPVVLQRGHLRGPGGHAGFHRPPDPVVPAPRDYHAARPGRPGTRPADHRQPGHLPGGAVVRHPIRAGPAGGADQAQGRDGPAGEPGAHYRDGQPDHRHDHRLERVPAVRHLHRLRERAAQRGTLLGMTTASGELDQKMMTAALAQAQASLAAGGVPVGAVLATGPDIVAEGHNERVQLGDPVAHGEIACLRNAGRQSSYQAMTLYTTLSPCPMCTGAILLFQIPRVVVGEAETFAGDLDFLIGQGVSVTLLDDERCKAVMREFQDRYPAIWSEDIGGR